MSAEDIVTGLIDAQTNLAADLASTADDLVFAATTALQGVFTPSLDLTGVDTTAVPEYEEPDTLNLDAANIDRPGFTATLDDLAEIDPVTLDDPPRAPTTAGGDPGSIDQPNNDINSFTQSVPDIDTTFEDVEIPDIAEFEPLDLITIDPEIRDIEVNIPPFRGVAPTFLGETPSQATLLQTLKTEYNDRRDAIIAAGDAACSSFYAKHYPDYDTQVASIDAHLSAVMSGTATAWDNTTMQTLYDFERTQAEAQRSRVEFEASRNRGRRGAVTELTHRTTLNRAEQDAVNASVLAAYTVAEKRADRELQHLQFVMGVIQQMRGLAQQTWLAYNQFLLQQNQFALSFAQACIETYIQAHNLAIQRYNADLQAYQTEAQVWETRIRYALIEFEVAKLELEYELMKLQINQQRIAELQAKLSVEEMKIRVAATRIQAIAQQLELRKLPLEIFRAQIDAYRAYLDGRRTETDIYRALIDGERAITDNDRALIDQYRVEVDAWRTIAATKIDNNRNTIDRNRYLIEVFRTYIDKFRTDLDYERARTDVTVQNNRVELDRYGQEMRNEENKLRASLDTMQLQFRAATEYDQMRTEYIINLMRNFNERLRQIGDVNVKGAEVLSSLAAAVMVANGSNVSLINQTNQTG